jgi:hypothetical protein
MPMDNSSATLPHSGTAETFRGTSTGMTQAAVVGDESRALDAARYSIGSHLLREPDYRQILRWAETSGMAAEEVMERLADSSVRFAYEVMPMVFAVEDGAMVSVVWDFGVFPFIPDNWESGLVIRDLGFAGKWPDAATALRPRLPSLRALCCRGIGLERLDLSHLAGLTRLDCWENGIDELDLSPVPALTELSCGFNSLTELDLSALPGLTTLDCGYNRITGLDLSPGLTDLVCGSNGLAELDLSPASRLTRLHCWGNSLTQLDLSPLPSLTELSCGFNSITALDLSPVPILTRLDCCNSRLAELDLSAVPGLGGLRCDERLSLHNAPADIKIVFAAA